MITTRPSVPERAGRYLDTMPPGVAGQDGHGATFRAACICYHGFALDEDASLGVLLSHFNPRCSPPWTLPELVHKVRSAAGSPSEKGRGYLLGDGEALPPAAAPAADLRPKYPKPDPERIAVAVKDGPGALELWSRSPVLLDVDDGSNCAEILRALFPGDPLLCIGKGNDKFATRPLPFWLLRPDLPDLQLIVPGPMSARTGKTKEGKESEHTLANTAPRAFVVVEFDTGTADEHAARLWHLGGFAPLALVVHSGGKSLHGWFPVGDAAPEEVEKFMRYAASIGADPALFRNRSQFVRLPAGTREGGCRQSVFYWNPAALVNGKEAA